MSPPLLSHGASSFGRASILAVKTRINLAPITAAMRVLVRENLPATAEVAVIQTLAAIVYGVGLDNRPEIVMRTAIHDANTCQGCLDVDGTVVVVGSEFEAAFARGQHCYNPPKCRCSYAPITQGKSGWGLHGEVTEVSDSQVSGEVTLRKEDRPDPQFTTEQSESAYLRLRRDPKRARQLTLPRSIAKVADDSPRRTSRAGERAETLEAQRLIRDALTSGRFVFARNVLAAVRHLVNTGTVPPLVAREARDLRVIM